MSLAFVSIENSNVFQDLVVLNVGGKKHEVRWDTLDKFPKSRLGRLRHYLTAAPDPGEYDRCINTWLCYEWGRQRDTQNTKGHAFSNM